MLRGDPTDPEIVWLAPFPGLQGDGNPERTLVIWPRGFRAVFEPSLTVVDANGAPRIEGGDFVDGGCVTDGERLLIVPSGDGFRLDCGPMDVGDCTSGRVSQASRKVGEMANGRKVEVITFLNPTGKFRVLYEDGSTCEGFTSTL